MVCASAGAADMNAATVNSAASTVWIQTATSGTFCALTCETALGSRWSSPETKIRRAKE
ncbi:hypothetical protein AB0L53_24965 [Nonomuraea sp. NPDC052129]|uniref:hypothetical protein n=1 Tax=Nonomuraea sp. NPDC052129 TaxID=3154651 RepID=UPI003449C93D